MHNKHLNIKTIERYLLNLMSYDEETAVQEHLNSCPECRKKIEGMRKLRSAMEDVKSDKVVSAPKKWYISFYRSPLTRIAAVLLIFAGVGFAIYKSGDKPKGHIIQDGLVPETVLSVDSLPKCDADSTPEVYNPQDTTAKDSLEVK